MNLHLSKREESKIKFITEKFQLWNSKDRSVNNVEQKLRIKLKFLKLGKRVIVVGQQI